MKLYCFPVLVTHSSCKTLHESPELQCHLPWMTNFSRTIHCLFLRETAFQLQPRQNFWLIDSKINQIALSHPSSDKNYSNFEFSVLEALQARCSLVPSTGLWK